MLEPAPERCERLSVGARVRHKDNEVAMRIVALLEGEASLERLAIADVRLGLDPAAPSRRLPSGDLRVPGPQVTRDGQSHLGSPPERRMESRPELLQKSQLRPIPNRIPGRIGPNGEVETDDRAIRSNEFQRRIPDPRSLESAHFHVRNTDRLGDFALAEPSTNSGLTRIAGHSVERLPAASSPSIRRPLTRRHRPGSSHRALHRGFTLILEHPVFQRADRELSKGRAGPSERHLERRLFQLMEDGPDATYFPPPDRYLEHPVFHGRTNP